MPQRDNVYLHLLQTCQSIDLELRLEALGGLHKQGYLDLVPVPFLLDRLNSTTIEREQAAILKLMGRRDDPLPEEVLMAMLGRLEALPPDLLEEVAKTLSLTRAEEFLDLLLCLLEDAEESPDDSAGWEEQIPAEVLLALLAHPDPAVCAGALDVFYQLPAQALPIERILPYCAHEQGAVRKAALTTLLVAEQRVPPEPILTALRDPDPGVRSVASHACISLVEWFGERTPLEPLVQALNDESPAVREDVLDALGKAPLRAPVEPVVAALTDSGPYVRYAAVETLGLMGEHVPPSIYPIIQVMSASDADPRVRQRAELLLRGI